MISKEIPFLIQSRERLPVAINGTEGLRKVKELNPDLTILDVMMDEHTEGFQVACRLKNTDPNSEYAPFSKIPILILTSLTKRGHIKFNTQKDNEYLPVEAFLEKPVPPENFSLKMFDYCST